MKTILKFVLLVLLLFSISRTSFTQWIHTNGPDVNSVTSLALMGNHLFAGTAEGVFLSSDGGTNWRCVGLDTCHIWSLVVSGTDIFTGVTGGDESSSGVFRTTDNGSTWSQVSTITTVRALSVSGLLEESKLFAATDGDGVFLSTDRGTNWVKVNTNLTDTCVISLSVFGPTGKENLLAGTWKSGVFLSTNNGANWNAVNDGFPQLIQINAFAVDDSFLYVGTAWAGGVWKRALSDLVTSVKTTQNFTPVSYRLCQNFPNPFNPSTVIQFEIPVKTFVTIKIYNQLGQEIATIVDELKLPGIYEVKWDASNVPSGAYYYKINTGEFVETKKLILLK